MSNQEYDHRSIESKWQRRWEQERAHVTGDATTKPKKYILDMFPYPSGYGLHVGHAEGYVATDIIARHQRMKGFAVMHPMGWDAFGLPAENYAIKEGVPPPETTQQNIANFKRQDIQLGLSYDWERELNTSDPLYYRWTQWMFLQLFQAGLAYQKEAPVNWCEHDQTVLANEQVVDGRCDRCGELVTQKKMKQWFFKITDYAERLLDDLHDLAWPEFIKTSQRNWIGKSSGAEVVFALADSAQTVTVFTTRPDTLWGATYLVLAPEHDLIEKITTSKQKESVARYQKQAAAKSELTRTQLQKEKTGVFTGAYAINPVNQEKIPVWVADYVVSTYGTGAIMAVPAHDERDFAFARAYKLPIKLVVKKPTQLAKSYLMGADDISDEELTVLGVTIFEKKDDGDRLLLIPKAALTAYEELITAKLTPGYWNEYLGDDFVFIFKDKAGQTRRLVWSAETEAEINGLAKVYSGGLSSDYLIGWLGDNQWYQDYLIHVEPGVIINSGEYNGLFSETVKEKITADLAAKGMGQAKITYRLRDWLISRQRYWGAPIPIIHCDSCGPVAVPENQLPVLLPTDVDFHPHGHSPLEDSPSFTPVTCPKCQKPARRETDTMDTFVCSSWYYLRYASPENTEEAFDAQSVKQWLPVDVYVGGAEHAVLHLLYARFFTKFLFDQQKIDFIEPFTKLRNVGMILGPDHRKMSKSIGNVINPDDVINEYGADTLRLYEVFMGPFADEKPWVTESIKGVARFLHHVWKIVQRDDGELLPNESKQLAPVIKKVDEDIINFHFNTAIASMMGLVGKIGQHRLSESGKQDLLRILFPFAPHLTSELWEQRGLDKLYEQSWPEINDQDLTNDTVVIVVQINGKLRGTITGATNTDAVMMQELAQKAPNVAQHLEGKKLIKVITVPNRVINFIVSD